MSTEIDNELKLKIFMEKKAEIDRLLKRLHDYCDIHFGVNTNDISWDEIGSLGYVSDRIRQASDFLFHEGEHAEK